MSARAWTGQVPASMTRIASPTNSVFLLGRTLVANDDDLPAAHALAAQMRIAPLNA